MKNFKYLNCEAGRNPADVLVRPETPHIVAFDATDFTYCMFDSVSDLFEYIMAAPRSLHEVTFGGAQRFKVDIDAPASVGLSREYIETIIGVIEGVFLARKKILPTIRVYCSNTNKSNDKFSYHLITNEYLSCSSEAADFCKEICALLADEKIPSFIDTAVYKSVQNFRFLYCASKSSAERIKYLENTKVPNICDFEDSLICGLQTPAQAIAKPIIITAPADSDPRQQGIINAWIAKIKEVPPEWSAAHRFYRATDSIILYKRTAPSHCEFCKREHVRDNTLYLFIAKTMVSFEVTLRCRRSTESRVIANLPLEEKLAKYIDGRGTNDTLADFPSAHMHKYCADSIAPLRFSHNGAEYKTLLVRAQMGLGKTKALREMINFYNPSRVCFVSFRRTFTAASGKIFPELTLYSTIKGEISEPKIIVQVESLHRIKISEPFDLLVLDESESIIEQFDAGLSEDLNKTYAVFKYLLQYSKRIVAMDALLGRRTVEILKAFSGKNSDESPQLLHINTYVRKTNTYYLTTEKPKMLGILYNKIAAGNKVAIAISSLCEAKVLARNIRTKHPHAVVQIYSSETPASEKRRHFADVAKYWSLPDVLIFTPTVSAGVSYELPHYDYLFGYFLSSSCPVESCLQMLGRVRQINKQSIIIYCQSFPVSVEITEQDLMAAIATSKRNLFKNLENYLLGMEYDESGVVKYLATPFLRIWVENTLVKNQSMANFTRRFINYLCDLQQKIVEITPQIFKEICAEDYIINGEIAPHIIALVNEHRTIKSLISEENTRGIVLSEELSEEGAHTIAKKIQDECDVSPSEHFAFEKYNLRNTYEYHGRVDENFVDTFNKTQIKSAYRHTKRIIREPSFADAAKAIQNDEKHRIICASAKDEIDPTDILAVNKFDHHRLALGCLNILGISSIGQEKYAPAAIMSKELAEYLTANTREVQQFLSTHRLKRQIFVENDIVDYRIAFAIIKIMYDMNVKENGAVIHIAPPTLWTIENGRIILRGYKE